MKNNVNMRSSTNMCVVYAAKSFLRALTVLLMINWNAIWSRCITLI